MQVIQAENLTKYYGKARGIEGVNLSVGQGDIFGFIGPNGAGKSTFIRTVLGLIRPNSGKAEVLGLEAGKNQKEILKDIGYMPSESMFYDEMRVGEIISFSAKLRGRDCSMEAGRLCEQFALDARKKIGDLSLGNRKKVSIVCAFQHMPELYILDEPTSGLDPLMQREFFSLVKQRQKDGATIFLSSHVLSEIQRYCKNAAIIREGQILVCAPVETLSKTSARHITLQGICHAPELSGVLDVKNYENSVSFLYQGNIQNLIAALNGMPVTDLTVAEPDLEEIFMHFYSEGGAAE